MFRFRFVVALAVVLGVTLVAGGSGDSTYAQAQAPRQVPVFPAAVFRGVQTPARYFTLSQAVIDFKPGAASATGSEQSVRFFVVMEGELAVTVDGKTALYAAGKNFSVPPGVALSISNEGRTANARIFVSSLVPARGEGAVVVRDRAAASSEPRVLSAMRMPMGPLPGVIDVTLVGNRYDPGFATGQHVMNEVHAFLHLEGTTSYEYVDGAVETFGSGQGAQMYVGRPGLMANRTAVRSAYLLTWLATPGKPLTSAWR